MRKDIFKRIARMEVSLTSVCRFILFYVGLTFILILVDTDFAAGVFQWTLGLICSFCVLFTLYARVMDDPERKGKKEKDGKEPRKGDD